MSINNLLEDYRNLSKVDDEITQSYATAVRIQLMHHTGDVIPMSSFLSGLGTIYTDETGYGNYLNKVGIRGPFIPSLNPTYFTEFEGKDAIIKYPYVLWIKKS